MIWSFRSAALAGRCGGFRFREITIFCAATAGGGSVSRRPPSSFTGNWVTADSGPASNVALYVYVALYVHSRGTKTAVWTSEIRSRCVRAALCRGSAAGFFPLSRRRFPQRCLPYAGSTQGVRNPTGPSFGLHFHEPFIVNIHFCVRV